MTTTNNNSNLPNETKLIALLRDERLTLADLTQAQINSLPDSFWQDRIFEEVESPLTSAAMCAGEDPNLIEIPSVEEYREWAIDQCICEWAID